MNKSALKVKLINELENAALEQGFELVSVEVEGAMNHPTITVYLDQEGGINIDTLASANSWVSEIVEKIMDKLDVSYVLDVSSPGINRPLRTIEHFQKAIGQTVVIKAVTGDDSSAKFKGELIEVDGPQLILKTKSEERLILINEVISANLSVKIVF